MPYLDLNRWLSVLVALGYAGRLFVLEGFASAALVLAITLVPLGLIWFPEGFASFTGFTGWTHIVRESPVCFVRAFGWFFLLLPAGIVLVVAIVH